VVKKILILHRDIIGSSLLYKVEIITVKMTASSTTAVAAKTTATATATETMATASGTETGYAAASTTTMKQ
jgi:hypothetical protein